MINTKALREKILDLAMRGKLVPQNPTDEPASVLLDKIKEEKEQLIKEKKIKKEKSLPEISKEEIPYEIPDSWEWVRIGEVQLVKGGKRVPKGKQLVDYPTEKVYLRVADMKNGTINTSKLRYATNDIYEAIKNYTISSSDLYLSIAGTIGKVGSIPTELNDSLLTENAVKIVNFSNLNSKYILYMLQAKVIQEQFNKLYNQVAQPKLSIRSINQTISPVPPLGEQQRIVAKIEELFALIDTIESNQMEFKQLAGQLDKKILDLAMRGKLVPQNPTDEPASVLLDKIKEEKEQLIKEKKIKKEKPLPEISKEEIPYEVPDSWEWVNLQLIADYIQRGKSPKYSNIERYPVISQKCIQWTGINMSEVRFIEPSTIEKYDDIRIVKKNDILWNSTGTGTVGRVGIVKQDNIDSYEKVVVDSHVTLVRTNRLINSKYIFLFLSSNLIQKNMDNLVSGTTKQKELSLQKILKLNIPLPPLKEQKRIVAKIEMIRESIQKINFE